jgi:hypothetical protein
MSDTNVAANPKPNGQAADFVERVNQRKLASALSRTMTLSSAASGSSGSVVARGLAENSNVG